jgi:hypothetical protein
MLLLRRNEQRLTFGSGSDPDQDQPSAALVSSSTDEHPAIKREQPVTSRPLGLRPAPLIEKFSGICIRVNRLLRFGRENIARSQCSSPADARVPIFATNLTPAEANPNTVPTLPHAAESGLGPGQENNSLDNCQVLLSGAIERVHAPATSQTKTVRDLAREDLTKLHQRIWSASLLDLPKALLDQLYAARFHRVGERARNNHQETSGSGDSVRSSEGQIRRQGRQHQVAYLAP